MKNAKIIWAGQQPLFKQHLQLVRYNTHRHVVGNVPSNSIIFSKNYYIEKYFDEKSLEKVKEDGKKLLDPEIGSRLIRNTKKAIEEFWDSINLLKKDQIHFNRFNQSLLNLLAYFMTSTEYVVFHVEERIKEILNYHYGENYYNLYLILTTPTRLDIIYKEKIAWIEVMEDTTNEKIKQHMLKFPFLFVNIENKEHAFQLMKDRLKEKTIDELKKEITKAKIRLNRLKRTQSIIYKDVNSKELFYLTNLLRAISTLRLGIKSCWSGVHYYLFDFFREISEKTGHSIKDVMMLYSTEDIKNVLENKKQISNEEIDARRKAYLYHFDNGNIHFYSGDEAIRKKNELIPEDKKNERKTNKNYEIKGTIANPGKIKGKVLLLKSDDLREITRLAKTATKQHILVTSNTNPNMMILLEKIGGIAADEGGITCHAAIISRELNIPCIVGCKNATKIFKSEDILELKGNKVKRI